MGKRWVKERKRDYYYRKAKEMGARSRAYFKLLQINRRYRVLRRGMRVLDLGAAPGGWSRAALELVGGEGFVVGVDLKRIEPMEGAVFIRGDVRRESTLKKVEEVSKEFDVIISDMSPNISGIYTVDQARSAELALTALEVAERFLKVGGAMVVKLFEGEDTKEVLKEYRKRFSRVDLTSPKASRTSSSEIYIIARGFGQSR
ncbi:MAG: RlmE family RNA methyltransferase [Thermoplasmata archaeon]|nr:RlmE family RNA methyltransferase [Thermoplasmata archaeon]RLF69251.1 MAG: 23S rRNA (uridine(2552)-2'-O)-methyltransferase [Thermoplasmata archaeon]RLF69577.1 MAG: 23S rRNA (uridine(2552)-2'-O)-methyltransferase [Thermoplasmata archaeon]RLF73670.1 MAG: 23S rRNA (uridine(2552)-2'-O)-methyltransferase [Thermoplasmata archaeon]HDD60009.1 RlmE family RNA methyltransferase [Euryarchaeota archaeon]